MQRRPFNQSEKEYLLHHRLQMPAADLAKELGCSKSKVASFFRRKGLKLPPEVREHFRTVKLKGRTSFTPEMDQFLMENYLTMPIKPLGEKIGKSFTGCMIRLRQLGLEIPQELREQRKRKGQRKKGEPSFNKGLKITEFMSKDAIARCSTTRFKKGCIPHNTKKIGHTRRSKDGYVQVKTAEGYRFKHHLVYEKHFGKIPAGMMITFKDGNPGNLAPSNLEVITKKENLKRNWLELPPPLKKAIKLTNKITKEL